ncbi:MAG: hypothetical protein Q9206_006269 [Seirophora lacunosa]
MVLYNPRMSSRMLAEEGGGGSSLDSDKRLSDPVDYRRRELLRTEDGKIGFWLCNEWIQIFKPFVPPSPSSLPKAAPPKTYRRTRKWSRRLVYLALGLGATYEFDQHFFYASLTRSARTFWLSLIVATDYKINFRAHPLLYDSIQDLHLRNAERLFDLLRTNGGLYLKIGQAIAMQSAILPPEFQKMFSKMFDDAPQNDWKDAEKVILEDFGKTPEELFGVSFAGEPGKGVMERTARASASVAQVHWARLANGDEVAIKIQKREIAQQVGWDLWTFNLVPYISERLLLETDFVNEADNAERMGQLVAGESRLRGRVYIPKVYRELSSHRVMTAEWIEGVRLWDKETLTRPWHGGWRQGSPGCRGTPLDPPNRQKIAELIREHPLKEHLKPKRDSWKGSNGSGGLGVSLKDWNIFIRRLPSGKPELVLIDHGLYVQMQPEFRHQYSLFWKSLMTFDNKTIGEIVRSWGINNPDVFASATLMRPYTGGDNSTSAGIRRTMSKQEQRERTYEMQQQMQKGIREVLADEKKWPRELVFIGRNMRIVQGNNQYLGAPVNRIKIMGGWASRSLVDSPDLGYRERLLNFGRHVLFRFVLFSSDVLFYSSKVAQFFGRKQNLEDDMEASMKKVAVDMGFELNHGVFEG